MHSRMRARASEFQKVLNRAKTEAATTERKTVRYERQIGLVIARSVDRNSAAAEHSSLGEDNAEPQRRPCADPVVSCTTIVDFPRE